MAAKRSSARHSAFFDLEKNPERDGLTRPQSMLRSTEWGGLTLVSLLAGLAFPPYFVSVMALACLNAGGMLWVSHLNDAGRKRLREFEREFSQGHALEESGDYRGAAAFYGRLVTGYQNFPRIAGIARHQCEQLRQTQPDSFPTQQQSKAGKMSPEPVGHQASVTQRANKSSKGRMARSLGLKRKPT